MLIANARSRRTTRTTRTSKPGVGSRVRDSYRYSVALYPKRSGGQMLAGRPDVRAGALRIQGNELSRSTLWVLNCISLDLCGDWERTWRRKAGRTGLGGWQAVCEGELGPGEVPTRGPKGGPKEGHVCCVDRDPRFAQMSGCGLGEGCGDWVHELSCSWGVWQKLSIRCATLSGGISSARTSRPSLQIGQRCDEESGSWE